jgi:hypothetical protein
MTAGPLKIEGALRSRLLAQRRSSLKLMVSFNRSRGLPAPSIVEGSHYSERAACAATGTVTSINSMRWISRSI